MKKVKLHGFVLKQSAYSESSLIIRFLSKEHGLIGIIAKGFRKNTEHRQLLNMGMYEIGVVEPKEAGLWLLYDFDLMEDNSVYPSSATWVAAESGLELISKMIVPNEDFALLYQLAERYLSYLHGVAENAILIYWRLFFRLLKVSGIGSPLDACCVCNGSIESFRVIETQHCGFLCRSCESEINNAEQMQYLSPASSEILRLLPEIGNHLHSFKVGRKEVSEINQLLERYWHAHHKQTLKLNSLSVLSQFYN